MGPSGCPHESPERRGRPIAWKLAGQRRSEADRVDQPRALTHHRLEYLLRTGIVDSVDFRGTRKHSSGKEADRPGGIPPAPKADTGEPLLAAVSAATPVTRFNPLQGVSRSHALSAVAAPVANPSDQGSSGFGTLRLLAVIVGGLFLVYAGVRLVLGPVEPDMPGLLRFGTRRYR